MSILLKGDVKAHLLRLTLPTIAGTLAMMVFILDLPLKSPSEIYVPGWYSTV